MRAGSLDPIGAADEHLGRDRLGVPALHLGDACTDDIPGKPGAHEHDEAVDAPDPVPAEGERVDVELDLLVATKRNGHYTTTLT